MVARNRVAAIDPPIDDTGPDTAILYRPRKQHELAKPSRILSERESHTEFQYRLHIIDTDDDFANAVSETPIKALLLVGISLSEYSLEWF